MMSLYLNSFTTPASDYQGVKEEIPKSRALDDSVVRDAITNFDDDGTPL